MLQLDFQRYECKYIIPEELRDPIAHFVSCYTRPDRFTATGERNRYRIVSLYLDSPQLTFHYAKSHRALNRMKLRIRSYGVEPTGPVFLEIKRKIKDVIFKRRVGVLGADWFERWSRGEPFLLNADSLRDRDVGYEFIKLQQLHNAVPAMLVSYTREAWESEVDDYARVTFDRKVLCKSSDSYCLFPAGHDWMSIDDPITMGLSHSGTILELKFANHPPFWMVELVKRFGLRQRGFSKYSSSVTRGLGNYWSEDRLRNHI